MRRLSLWLVVVATVACACGTGGAGSLGEEIARIRAIDNHAHPLRVVRPGEAPDTEYDALPLDALEPFANPVPVRTDGLQYVAAWRFFYGYSHDDRSESHLRTLLESKRRVAAEQGDRFPVWVLDRLGIETMLANRVAMGRGLGAPRFLWVPFADPLVFPLSNEAARRRTPDYRVFYPGEEKLLRRYAKEAGLDQLPGALDEYCATVVTPTLESQRRAGAVAVKFEAAYLRKLDFDDPDEAEARRVYSEYVQGGEPGAGEYKNLQDYLFRYVAREAGRVGLVVHIHVADGAGAYYRQSGSDPLLLESAFNDPSLRKTNFVVVHGGEPFHRQVGSLMSKPNVYADFSAQTFVLYPRSLAALLRDWLEYYPEKVLFGTDAFAMGPEVGWEEIAWQSTTTARRALQIALVGMIADGEITRGRAVELARMALRENALKLYGLAR